MRNDPIRVGSVSAFHPETGTVDVRFFSAGDRVATGLTMLSHEYRPLEPDETVLCFFYGDGEGRGVCLGRIYTDVNLPVNPGMQFVRVNFREAFIEYNRDEQTLTVNSPDKIILQGDVEIEGALLVKSNDITVQGGDVVADGVSLKDHAH